MSSETIHSLGTAMSRNELTSEALVGRLLSRAAAAEPVLQAFATLPGEDALCQARGLDAERRAGRVHGPLHGVPVVLTDVFDVARQATTGGSRLYADNIAADDAPIVGRLRDAGAIVLAKTRMVELGFGGWGTNAVMGTPRNPWDMATHRAPGGSCSGAAVAVAAGLAPAGIGTDTGGSVRIPAALCGLVGLKTTAGRVPCAGVMRLSQTLDTIGPITRTVADARLLFQVLAGVAPDNAPLPERPRIGILTSRDIDEIDNDVLAGYDDFVGHLGDIGASLTEYAFGDTLDSFVERMSMIMACEGWHSHGLRILQNPDRMDPHVRARFLQGQRVADAHYQAALAERAASMADILQLLGRFDALLTPTTPIPAPPLTQIDEKALPLSRYTRLVNYLGLCALAVPAGLGAGDLPVSVQLIGKPGSEALLLALGEALEQRRGVFPQPDLGLLRLP